MRLSEIAYKITGHLHRFQADPKINVSRSHRGHSGTVPYWNAGAHAAGRYVAVTYVSYQGTSHLTKSEAERYLAWLEAGNVGTHYVAFAENIDRSLR